jgi:hypothetical protein
MSTFTSPEYFPGTLHRTPKGEDYAETPISPVGVATNAAAGA